MRLRVISVVVGFAAALAVLPARAADAPAATGAAQPRPRKKPVKPTVAKRKKQKPADSEDQAGARAKMMAAKPVRTLRPQALRVLGDGASARSTTRPR